MTNEAAERLRAWIIDAIAPFAAEQSGVEDLDAALAAERKATVERIRAQVYEHIFLADLLEILDAEAGAEATDSA